jgi:hypothetical protein
LNISESTISMVRIIAVLIVAIAFALTAATLNIIVRANVHRCPCDAEPEQVAADVAAASAAMAGEL